GDGQVLPGLAEHGVFLHVHHHIEVSGRSPVLTRRSLPRDLDPLAVGDAGGDAGLDLAGALAAPASAAGRAGVVGDQTAALALAARLGQREAAQVLALVPGARALGADLRRTARPGAAALAGRAGGLAAQRERPGDALGRLVEGQRGLGLHVGAAPRGRGPAPAAEQAAEQVAQPLAAARRAGPPAGAAEQVPEVESARTGAPARPVGPAEQGAGVVVLLAALLVRQDAVGLGDLLEALLGLLVALVGVGVVGAGELAVGGLDLVLGRRLRDSEDLVVVLFEVVLGAHRRLPSPASASAVSRCRRPPPRVRSCARGGGRFLLLLPSAVGGVGRGGLLLRCGLPLGGGPGGPVRGGSGRLLLGGARHDHPGRAEHPLADEVPRL